MSALSFMRQDARERLGFKGAGAAQWLAAQGIPVPAQPNTWAGREFAADTAGAAALLVARLGATEFFLEEGAGGTTLKGIVAVARAATAGAASYPPAVYPVLREDCAFRLEGEGVHEVLAQVCNVNFAALASDSRPVIMTLMIGVAVLVVGDHSDLGRRYLIWCDPTFGEYLGESLGAVVNDCGGSCTGVRG